MDPWKIDGVLVNCSNLKRLGPRVSENIWLKVRNLVQDNESQFWANMYNRTEWNFII